MVSSVSTNAISDLAASQASSKKTIAGNFDQFLQLLTTQLQNQNPLDPLDTNQFTQQLVEFSSVEQQLKTNDLLTTLVTSSTADRAASAAGYLGATITADGSTTALTNGKASWAWTSARAASKATISVIDKSGATVYTATGPINAGPGGFDWDGRSDDGSMYKSGDFTLKVDAQDVSGQPVTVSTEVSGKVDAVDLSGDVPVLKIGTLSVSLDKIKTLSRSVN